MEHPHHDDSHLPEEIENSDDNIEKLIEVMIPKMQEQDWIGYTWAALEKEFTNDYLSFRDSWKTHMEET